MDINKRYGIKGCFQVVPEERYAVSPSFLDSIRSRGHEINVHDLNHDGNLFISRKEFLRRAREINRYGREFGARGFRAAVLYRRVEWLNDLEFSYDMSIPNVAHLDPQRGGCCTVMPFFIGDILEIPVTTVQDYTLFNILSDYSLALWKRQIEEITQGHGLASFIVHPDYLIEPRARSTYEDLLKYLSELRDLQDVWLALPGEIDNWWRSRARMHLVERAGEWHIEGDGHERARIAYACLEGDGIVYRTQRGTRPEQQVEEPSAQVAS